MPVWWTEEEFRQNRTSWPSPFLQSERLHVCLKLNNIKAEVTAPYRSCMSKSWERRLHTDVDKRCLLYQGSTDMIISVQGRMEGILNVIGVEQKDVNEEVDTSPCRQASGRFQIGHQMPYEIHIYRDLLCWKKLGNWWQLRIPHWHPEL